MRPAYLPVSCLPPWARLNNVVFRDVAVVENHEHGGYGLAATQALTSSESDDDDDTAPLVRVPRGLVLCADSIAQSVKADQHFGSLLGVAGGKNLRADALLFLLMQMTMAAKQQPLDGVGVSGPWTEYVKMLPEKVLLPTTWSEGEMGLLAGTSLEKPLAAKLGALLREFELLREKTSGIPWCHKAWWNADFPLDFNDWILIDSWYRSRSLELPLLGEAMVPCLDMANHSVKANAHYQQSSDGDVLLLLWPGQHVEAGEELTISYGSAKTAAEMLFSYGFIDSSATAQGLVLYITPGPDDPLAKAKLRGFGRPPTLQISASDDSLELTCPFVHLMCVGEEDGLSFKTLLANDGTAGELQVFWHDVDVTDRAGEFEDVLRGDALEEVFRLRATVLLRYMVEAQLERLSASEDRSNTVYGDGQGLTGDTRRIYEVASRLRSIEGGLLSKTSEMLEAQTQRLSQSPTVVEYLQANRRAIPEEEEEETHGLSDFR